MRQSTTQGRKERTDELVNVSVRISAETAERLRERAEAHYRPVAAHLRLLIERDLEQEEAAA